MNHIEAIFCPSEFAGLRQRDLRETVCVVFDVLRATSTLLAAFASGAESVEPVAGIPEALAGRAADPTVMLAGERNGLRIDGSQTGGVEFDLGNSPREFTPDRVRGRRIVMTTTNGTRALHACTGAAAVLAASFGNLSATAHWLTREDPRQLLLVCAGTLDHASLEDTLAAGALADELWHLASSGWIDDAVRIARDLYRSRRGDLLRAVAEGRNGHRLLSQPQFAGDVPVCLERDRFPFIARLDPQGRLRAELPPPQPGPG
ncbi:MAG: 2-phosphosulfolactate phosphatase [Verrucomicrobiales bacterium]|nr:2-phosphosulfolactate phosphatase [Verrucomicrobiales bacterium]